jgi:hypothetical protein
MGAMILLNRVIARTDSFSETCRRMVVFSLRRLYFFLLAFPAHWALQYLFLLFNVVKTFPQIEHFFWMIPIQ